MSKRIDRAKARVCIQCEVLKQPNEFGTSKVTVCRECLKIRTRKYTEKVTGRKVKPIHLWQGDYRVCSMCGILKHRSEYALQSRGGGRYEPFAHCRECHNARQRERYQRPEVQQKQIAEVTEHYRENKTRIRSERILLEYGITLEDKQKMLEQNGGRCPICGTDDPGNYWVIDHCHATGQVRGVLCNSCNKALGFFRDNPSSLCAAILYLLYSGRAEETATYREGIPKPDEELETEEVE